MEKEVIKVTARCPIRTTLELIGGKWKLLILFQLANAPYRLSALRKQIPDISEKMLIQELKNLLESGLVVRENFGEVPPRVEYQLTPLGLKVMPLIQQMREFALAYEQGIRQSDRSLQPDGTSGLDCLYVRDTHSSIEE